MNYFPEICECLIVIRFPHHVKVVILYSKSLMTALRNKVIIYIESFCYFRCNSVREGSS